MKSLNLLTTILEIASTYTIGFVVQKSCPPFRAP